MRKIRLIGLILFVAGAIGCGGKQKAPKKAALSNGLPKKQILKPKTETPKGLQIRLEELAQPNVAHAHVSPTQGQPLSESQTQELLSRLKKLESEQTEEFAFRERSLPPPRTGETHKEVFPPPQKIGQPSPVFAGHLEVERFFPKGEVNIAPKLSVTFSQPMVDVTSQADTVAKGVPVKIFPQIAGKWRWIGNKTLFFEPEKRFPMATKFKVEVPAGTRSAIGGKLKEAKIWNFETPAPRLVASYPTGGPHTLEPICFVSFDQAINPDAVLRSMRLADGKKTYLLQMVDESEIAQDERLMRFVKTTPKGHYLVFRPKTRLMADTQFSLTIGPGTPSAEGPLKTKESEAFHFRTYGPLKIERSNCTTERPCLPLSPLVINFSNPLDEDSFDAKQLVVKPPIPGMRVEVQQRRLGISGATKGQTNYEVIVPASLKDSFGQKLGTTPNETFVFGSTKPLLSGQGGLFMVLDPDGDKSFHVHTINHEKLRVRIYSVQPTDWKGFLDYSKNNSLKKGSETPPGKLYLDEMVEVGGKADELMDTMIPLKAALNKDGHGQLIVEVSPEPLSEDDSKRRFVLSWVQVTDLAVDAFVDHEKFLVWVTGLKDGRPILGAQISVLESSMSGETDEQGISHLVLPAKQSKKKNVLVVRAGDDVAILPESVHGGGGVSRWSQQSGPGERVRWYKFDDRGIYRPKEVVHVKGWVRLVDMGSSGGIRLLPKKTKSISYEVKDSRGNKIEKGKTKIGALGGFDLKFKLPDDANLGRANIQLKIESPPAEGGSIGHSFRIEEFRRPEFEVKTQVSNGPHLIGSYADLSMIAKYYAGGGLPDSGVKWQVAASKGHFVPPNRDEFTFVGWRPSWLLSTSEVRSTSAKFEGKTDNRGTHHLRVHFDPSDFMEPMSVRATAAIQDVNRQTWSDSSELLVHSSRIYVGLKTEEFFVDRGRPLNVDAIVTDLDGKAVAQHKVTMRAVRFDYRYEKGKWKTLEVDPQICEVVSKTDPVRCVFQTNEGGTYLIQATVPGEKGRKNRTEIVRWVSGGKRPPERVVEKEKVRLIPDKETYQPGDVAKILVQSPFSRAEGLLTVQIAGVLEKQRFEMKSSTKTLQVLIKETYLPEVSVNIEIVGSAPRLNSDGKIDSRLPTRPAYASGSVVLPVPPLKRKLFVELEPRQKELEPGGSTAIDLVLKDSEQKAVADGEIALIAVDEAVLALSRFRLGDIMSFFYPRRQPGVQNFYLRSS
ncbi:MAG: MG2 domain-containing protein, partial [Pseudomonadota bacterium]